MKHQIGYPSEKEKKKLTIRQALRVGALLPVLQGQVAHSQECLPPIPPENYLSSELIKEYEPEIRREFQEYFDMAQAFFRCLGELNVQVQKDVSEVLEQYRTFFPEG